MPQRGFQQAGSMWFFKVDEFETNLRGSDRLAQVWGYAGNVHRPHWHITHVVIKVFPRLFPYVHGPALPGSRSA